MLEVVTDETETVEDDRQFPAGTVDVPVVIVVLAILYEDTAACTKAVVAICVVFVPDVAVGAVGVPERAGLVMVAPLLRTTFPLPVVE